MRFLVLVLALCLTSAQGHVVQVRDRQKIVGVTETDDWWKTGVFYQIYPRSFMDGDGDGVGDLKGVKAKLKYLKDIGITGAWLSPIFKSPGVDQGYDISDYYTVDAVFGGNAALKKVLWEAKMLGLKIILDFVPNHTSDQNEWFKKSVNGTDGYEDYYVWNEGKVDSNGTRVPPNNWVSIFKGSSWTWNEQRKKFYLHQFATQQPDLNYSNPKVMEAMKKVLTYWLDQGVDGFRVDAVPYIMEDKELRDEPLTPGHKYDQNDVDCVERIYTKDIDETFDVVYAIRTHVDEYAKNKKITTRVLMSEAYADPDKTMRYYGTSDGKKLGAHFTFNFNLLTMIQNKDFKVADIAKAINLWMGKMPKIYTPNWVLGNHDNHRIASRLGSENVDPFNALTAFLPGVMVTYNGEEIGMTDGHVTCEEGQDPVAKKDCSTYNATSRDFERTPMQWDDSKNAGFTVNEKPWLPVADNYKELNVKKEKASPTSHLSIYKSLIQFRKKYVNRPSKKDKLIVGGQSKVLKLYRERDEGSYTLLFNVADVRQKVDLVKQKLLLTTKPSAQRQIGSILEDITLEPHETVILKTA
ncbi:unnamed protein product [Acanthoscelides obtectus]|uniref:alpha-glucosidase n=1 Tax=Acanthoscelides obtectus TaxID=200917 RepID=A0A9P0KVF4_ACAOB|nr:unnamed protein product [Acanthoscelides obtectus]CAK1676123.1 Maltase 1 [Acanthoscelides obtectus]